MKYIINKKGKVIFSCTKARYFQKGQGLCAVYVDGKWGFINTLGKIVIPCIYDDCSAFDNGVAIICKNNLWGLINITGTEIVPIKYKKRDSVPLPHESKICYNIGTEEKRIYKCIDVNGNHLFTEEALVPFEFSEGIAVVWKRYGNGGGYCVISDNGIPIIPIGVYDFISTFKYGVAQVTIGKKYGFINHQNQIIVPIEYDFIWYNEYPVCIVQKGNKYGCIDIRNGNTIFPCSLTKLEDIKVDLYMSKDGMCRIEKKGVPFYYNLDNNNLISLTSFAAIGRYSEGLCAVNDKSSGKLGFIDKLGELVIPCKFEGVYYDEFYGNICAINGGVINKKGELVSIITGGHFHVNRSTGYINWYSNDCYSEKLINLDGKVIYTGYKICDLGDFPVAVKKENSLKDKWGFIDEFGELVIPYQFNDSYCFEDGFATIDEAVSIKPKKKSSKSLPKRSSSKSQNSGGCYIATAVYGSYDCPEVWVLRRYRDNELSNKWYGKSFIRLYYAISPTFVKLFANCNWLVRFCRKNLDLWVESLKSKGIEDSPYTDRNEYSV